uniref:RNF34/RFFL SAP domain-containing protein n=1 Tax=Timema cristinae TaxID=61476 RepID=A0A7R9CRK2_TIMCR|nr:unnamed protein product [Timema cristinae]
MEEFMAGVFCRSNSVNSEQRSSTTGCEECSVKFTVFKRKKQCGVCQQYYCRDCLGHTDNNGSTTSLMARFSDKKLKCSRCKVLTARPLIRSELQQLRAKDLQQYLTSQHVSTRGCVEKDDLVNLLIRHVAVSSNRRETNPYSEPTFPGRAQPASTTSPPVSRSTPTQPAPSSNPLLSSPAHVGSESEAEYDVSSPTDSEVDGFIIVDGNLLLGAGVDLEITEMSETSGDGTLSDQGVEPMVTEVEELVENNTVESLPISDEDLIVSDLSECSRDKDLSIEDGPRVVGVGIDGMWGMRLASFSQSAVYFSKQLLCSTSILVKSPRRGNTHDNGTCDTPYGPGIDSLAGVNRPDYLLTSSLSLSEPTTVLIAPLLRNNFCVLLTHLTSRSQFSRVQGPFITRIRSSTG